jgi:hypothetical protein
MSGTILCSLFSFILKFVILFKFTGRCPVITGIQLPELLVITTILLVITTIYSSFLFFICCFVQVYRETLVITTILLVITIIHAEGFDAPNLCYI